MTRRRISDAPGAYETARKADERIRRRKGILAKDSPEYKEQLRKKHSIDGDCKCPYHVKARERARSESSS